MHYRNIVLINSCSKQGIMQLLTPSPSLLAVDNTHICIFEPQPTTMKIDKCLVSDAVPHPSSPCVQDLFKSKSWKAMMDMGRDLREGVFFSFYS